MKILLLLLSACVLGVASAFADTYAAPELKVVVSPDGSALVRVSPGVKPGAGATAIVARFDSASRDYRKVAEFTLRNPWAPVDVLITNDARYLVTLDDVTAIGRTENTVVVYRGTGEFLRAWKLTDIFSASELAMFAQSVSSTWWRESASVSEAKGIEPSIAIGMPKDRALQEGRAIGYPVYLDLQSLTFKK